MQKKEKTTLELVAPKSGLANNSYFHYTTILEDLQHSEDGNIRINEKTGEIKENNWKEKKRRNILLSESYKRLGKLKKSEKVSNCGEYLVFNTCKNGHKKLKKAYFCKDRLCPICSWRKSRMMVSQLHQILNVSFEEKPNMRYLFLTLTVKNCNENELSETIDFMMKGFERLIKYKKVKQNLLGFFRALEITRPVIIDDLSTGKCRMDEYHPHFHVLLGINPKYFKLPNNYITTKEWYQMWQKACQFDYQPNIDIRTVKPRKQQEMANLDDLEHKKIELQGAILETAKYSVKSSDYIIEKGKTEEINNRFTDEGVNILSNALARRRMLGFGGIFRDIKKKLKLQDLESKNADLVGADETGDCLCPICQNKMFEEIYSWHFGFNSEIGKKENNYFKLNNKK